MSHCMKCLSYRGVAVLLGWVFFIGCTTAEYDSGSYREIKLAMIVPPGFDPGNPNGLYDLCPGLENPGDVQLVIPPEGEWLPRN